jgi:hypothetical protein
LQYFFATSWRNPLSFAARKLCCLVRQGFWQVGENHQLSAPLKLDKKVALSLFSLLLPFRSYRRLLSQIALETFGRGTLLRTITAMAGG